MVLKCYTDTYINICSLESALWCGQAGHLGLYKSPNCACKANSPSMILKQVCKMCHGKQRCNLRTPNGILGDTCGGENASQTLFSRSCLSKSDVRRKYFYNPYTC